MQKQWDRQTNAKPNVGERLQERQRGREGEGGRGAKQRRNEGRGKSEPRDSVKRENKILNDRGGASRT